jgi:PAS domain S-box-containing protein
MKEALALPIYSHTAPSSQWPAWESLFEAMEDGVCVQSPDSRILMANSAFAEMVGLPAEQLVGKHCVEIFGCADEQGALPHFCARLTSLQTGKAASEEISGRQPGQRLRSRVSPVRDQAGQVIAFVMVVRDVTDVALREREQARVEQLARLGELMAGLAHEIKNPLAGIQGAVDILLQRRLPQDPERAVLEDVRREVARIDRAIQLLLNRARPRSLNFQMASLSDVVQRAVSLGQAIAATARGQIKISFQGPGAPILLSLDAAQIEDAVLNLIFNAIEALDGRGAINVSVGVESTPDGSQRHAVITVSDTGRGIPAENLSRIFNPFFTTNPDGTGLGLPAVRRIMRAHDGRVEVTSAVGAGTTFKLIWGNV